MSWYAPHLERLRLFYPVRWRLGAGVAVMAVTVVLQLAFPRVLAGLIDSIDVLKREGLPLHVGLLMAAAAVLFALATAVRVYLFESGSHAIVTTLRRRLFGVLLHQPVAFYDEHHIGELSSRLTADVQNFNDSVTKGAAYALRALGVLVGSLIWLIGISPSLSLLLVPFLPANLLLGKLAGKQFRQRSQTMQTCLAESGKLAYEYFAHIRLVHSMNQQDGALARYGQACAALFAAALSSARLIAVFQAVAALLVLLALLAAIWLGGHLIAQGAISVGDLTAFILYASMAGEAVGTLSEFWNTWMRMIGATDELFALLRTEMPARAALPSIRLSGELGLRGVDFRYPTRPAIHALRGVTIDIAAGEKIALVGASGAGKSTIASLILGHYQPASGAVLFDGIDAATLDLAALRRQIALVEQEPSLFSGSIADNLAFAVPERVLAPDELVAAARLANAHDFISSFPDGYATLVGERGVQLSGGQKQRIAIARAVLRDPRILILDEATSALDAASERLVQGALDRLMEGRTTLIIAHRFSTIVKSDRIVVLENGMVRQQGRHDDLLAQQDALYYRLMRHQLAQYRALGGETAATAHAEIGD